MAETKRILVAIDENGAWTSFGSGEDDDAAAREWVFIDRLTEHLAYHWIEADVPIPAATVIEGAVTRDEGGADG